MFDYYHYFVKKGNHPLKEDILNQEKNIDINRLINIIDEFKNEAVQIAPKPIGIRIMINHKKVLEYLDDSLNIDSLKWLSRKEKVVNETQHSSYYIFLDNIKSHQYDYMIADESYGICGGGFPIYSDNQFIGTITITGCRPHEDHQIIIDVLEKLIY